MWMAISVEFGPGIRLVAPSRSRNCSRLSQPLRCTTSCSIIAMSRGTAEGGCSEPQKKHGQVAQQGASLGPWHRFNGIPNSRHEPSVLREYVMDLGKGSPCYPPARERTRGKTRDDSLTQLPHAHRR